MPGRHGSSADYRYGFNGMEKDDEIKGSGNSYDFGARMYDSRIGRWFALDPLSTRYPYLSPYNFVANNPIIYVDPDGKEIKPVNKDADKLVLNTANRFNKEGVGLDIGYKNGTYTTKSNFSDYGEFKSAIKKTGYSYTKAEMEEGFNFYLGLKDPKIIEVQVSITGVAGQDNTRGDVVKSTGSGVDATVGIFTENPEYDDLNKVLKNKEIFTESVANTIYNEAPINLTTTTTDENGNTTSTSETVIVTPDKKGAGWVFFKNKPVARDNNTKGQVYVDGTGKSDAQKTTTLTNAISEIVKP